MSTYKQIAGTTVKAYTTNPSDPQEGEMWYNQTTLKLRGVTALAAWSSASPMSTAMDQLGGTGTQTAALSGAGGGLTTFEEYNGSGWSSGGSIPTAMELIQQLAGTQTAAICKGGLTPPGDPAGRYNNKAYTYDGSSWSSITDSGDARIRAAGSGTQTAYLVAGGASGPPTFTNRLTSSEEYNGSTWTEGGAMSTAREFLCGFGTQTASIMAGGAVPPSYGNSNASEQYDGTSFSSTPNINTARYGLAGSGTSTSNLIYGGGTGSNSAAAESYDGTSWSNKPSMATARLYLTRAGDSFTAALASGGNTTAAVGTTEEFNFSGQVVTPAAWSSGGALPTAVAGNGGAGTTNSSALSWGGTNPPGSKVNTSFSYDGTSWTATPTLGTAVYVHGSSGTATAALSAGGNDPPTTASEEYDGSSWTSGGTMNTGRRHLDGEGPQTASFMTGGWTGTAQTGATEEYDGTSWTNGGSLNTARYAVSAGGTSTAGLAMGGGTPGSPSSYSNVEEYNGTSWTEVTDLPTSKSYGIGYGPQTAAKQVTGYSGAVTSTSFDYDGTTFSTSASTSTASQDGNGSGTDNTVGVIYGGNTPSRTTATEEFNLESTSSNSVDITTAE